MTKLMPLFPRFGVLGTVEDPAYAESILRVSGSEPGSKGTVIVTKADKSEVEYKSDQISQDATTGRLEFESDGETYRVRELREDDGEWLSAYHISLPLFALTGLITQGATMALETGTETLTAYALDDSVYVVGLVYANGIGEWARVDGDWNLLSNDDNLYQNCQVMTIDPDKADEYIDLFDKNYVTVTDTEAYEAAEDDEPATAPVPTEPEPSVTPVDDAEEPQSAEEE